MSTVLTSEDDKRAPPVPSWTPSELARRTIHPLPNAAGTARCYSNSSPGWDLSFGELVEGLAEQCEAVHCGDLTRPESILVAQAYSLDAIFHWLMGQARENTRYSDEKVERYMRLALKAQNQCRTTLESLLHYKRPATVIAQQANVTSGPQQINNTVAIESGQNKLQEKVDGERMDARTTRADVGIDPRLEAVGAVHRTEDAGG